MSEIRQSQPSNAERPNFLIVVVDDMGYSDLQPFGGEIKTPVLQRLADRGARFRGFHSSSLCAPTRAMLLTGCDNHQAGLGVMPPFHSVNQYLQPGYEGYLPHNLPTVAELLRDAGYHTYLAGKWHVGHGEKSRPMARGFERSFAFMGGGSSHFNDVRALCEFEEPHTYYTEQDEVVENLPDDFYSSTFFVDKMLTYLREQDDDAPFFGYLTFTSPHDPLQVPDEWLDKYKGRYDDGYDAIRGPRLERMKELGLVSEDTPPNPGTGRFPTWDELDADEKRSEARKMEIYAAMLEQMDTQLGRVLDELQTQGKLDNTVVIFMSDNGANPKTPDFYPPNTPELIEQLYDNSLENYGKIGSFISEGPAWAEVSNTPLSYFKLTTYEGGIQVPLIVAGGPVQRRGVVTDELLHVADLLPTILDFAGVQRPTEWNGEQVPALYGLNLAPMLTGATNQPVRSSEDAICFEMTENKSVLSGEWKLTWPMPPYGDGDRWELYNLKDDPREKHDLAAEMPEKVKEMEARWTAYAVYVGYIPSDGSSVFQIMGDPYRFYAFEPLDDSVRKAGPWE